MSRNFDVDADMRERPESADAGERWLAERAAVKSARATETDAVRFVAEGWWHWNAHGGRVHDHGPRIVESMHRLCEQVYRRFPEADPPSPEGADAFPEGADDG